MVVLIAYLKLILLQYLKDQHSETCQRSVSLTSKLRFFLSLSQKEISPNWVQGERPFSVKEFFFLFLVYCAGFWLLILNQGIYWDDWCMFNGTPEVRSDIYNSSGRPFFGFLYNFLFLFGKTVIPSKLVGFIALLIPIVISYLFMGQFSRLAMQSRMVIALLIGLFPVNSSRMSLTMTQYGVSTALFFLGLASLMLFLDKKKLHYRVVGLLLFFLSFNMDSLLVFYAFVPVFIFYRTSAFTRTDIFDFLKGYADFLLLPIFFFAVKSFFFRPYGLYSNYNKVSLEGILKSPSFMTTSIERSFFWELRTLIYHLQEHTLFVMGLAGGLILLFKMIFSDKTFSWPQISIRFNFFFLGVGVVALLLAVFPYAALGIVADPSDWNDRHSILMPFGAACIVFFGIEFLLSVLIFLLSKVRLRRADVVFLGLRPVLYAIIVSIFVIMNNFAGLQFERDWNKQLSIVKQLRASEIVRLHSTFVVEDRTTHLNANGRYYRFYEYTGLMAYAFGNFTKYASADQPDQATISYLKQYPQYQVSDYIETPGVVQIVIEKGSADMTNAKTFDMLFDRFFDSGGFDLAIDGIVNLDIKKKI